MSSRSSRRAGAGANRGSLNSKFSISSTQPNESKKKDLWLDTTSLELKYYNGSSWEKVVSVEGGEANYTTVTVTQINSTEGIFDYITASNIVSTVSTQGYTGKFGNISGGNYVEISSSGKTRLLGDATDWEDENFDGLAATKGPAEPDLVSFKGTNILIPALDGQSISEDLNAQREIPHKYKNGTDIELHAHWYNTTTASGVVKLFAEYIITHGTVTIATGIVSATQSVNTISTWDSNRMAFGTVSGASVTFGMQMGYRLYRVPNDSDDTYTDDVAISTYGYHYQVDGFGSDTIATK